MVKFKFEYRITIAYLIIGGIWILFSDQLLNLIIDDTNLLTRIQTFKGWFYVLITAILFFMILKKHLVKLRIAETELKLHRNNLQQLVEKKTKDLTETQAQLHQAEKMASLGILTAGVSHELNNPLNYILGGITGLEKYFDNEKTNDENIQLFVNSIKTGVDRASSIVSGMNQLTSNKENYRQDCEIHAIIENCLKIANDQFNNKIRFNTNFADSNFIVTGNYEHLQQAITNILINAGQSIENEGTVSIITQKEEENVLIKVSDTGCGINQSNLSKITDPFYTTHEPGKGTGIGLSITYFIITAHGGKVNFQSELNKGTLVTIKLPIKSNRDE